MVKLCSHHPKFVHSLPFLDDINHLFVRCHIPSNIYFTENFGEGFAIVPGVHDEVLFEVRGLLEH